MLAHECEEHKPEKSDEEEPTEEPTQEPIRKMFSITYDLNGGQYNGSTKDITEKNAKGTEITVHAAPTREGYTFLYWKGSKHYPGDTYKVTEDHRFEAQWQKNAETGKKDDPGKTTTPATTDNNAKKTSPRTGDDANVILWLALVLASFAILTALLLSRRNRNRAGRR